MKKTKNTNEKLLLQNFLYSKVNVTERKLFLASEHTNNYYAIIEKDFAKRFVTMFSNRNSSIFNERI